MLEARRPLELSAGRVPRTFRIRFPRFSAACPIPLHPVRDFLPLVSAHGLSSAAFAGAWDRRNAAPRSALQVFKRSDHPLQFFFLGV